MNIISLINHCVINKYATFKGRAGKEEFTVFTVFYYLLVCVGIILERKYGKDSILAIVVLLCFLLVTIPSLAVTVRRIHDVNFSGWWYLLMTFVPIGVLATVILFFIKGTSGPNKYGEPPV